MKAIIASTVIAIATLTATVSTAASPAYCDEFSDLIKVTTQARDLGIEASTVYQNGIKAGLPSSAVAQMIQVVYIDGKAFSPEVLKAVSFEACLNG